MIPKKKEDYSSVEGKGRPFEMNYREPLAKNDEERQKPIVINLGDLNGQTYDKGMPKNFVRKAGRVLPTFDKYWTPEDVAESINEDTDIQ
jgi:hypothetical protein